MNTTTTTLSSSLACPTPDQTRRNRLSVSKTGSNNYKRWSALPIRLIVGYGFMAHGFAKLIRGPEQFAAVLHALSVPAPQVMSWLTIMVEILGGMAVLLGAFVPFASVPMGVVLVVAGITVHLPFGFSSIKLQAVTAAGPQFGKPGYELDILYLACLLALVLGGSGPLSVDGWRKGSFAEVDAEQGQCC